MPIVGELDVTPEIYRSVVAQRTHFIPLYCKTAGILLAVAGLLVRIWSGSYPVPILLLLAGLLVHFALPSALIGLLARRGFPRLAGVWRFELDDDGVTWAIPALRVTAGWSRVVTVDDRPDVVFLVMFGRSGVFPLLKSAFSEADREALAAYCRDRIAAPTDRLVETQ